MRQWAKLYLAPLELPELSTVGRLVYISLAAHANTVGRCYPSVDRLCLISGLGRTSIHKGLNELEGLGIIMREQRIGTSTVYTILPYSQGEHLDIEVSASRTPVSATRTPDVRDANKACSPSEYEQITRTEDIKEELKMLAGHDINVDIVDKLIYKLDKCRYWYADLFAHVAATPYLCGKNKSGWVAPVSWILRNHKSILSGKYAPWTNTASEVAAYVGGMSKDE